jgi:hypothetical protein
MHNDLPGVTVLNSPLLVVKSSKMEYLLRTRLEVGSGTVGRASFLCLKMILDANFTLGILHHISPMVPVPQAQKKKTNALQVPLPRRLSWPCVSDLQLI